MSVAKVGRAYVTLSLALLPAVVVVLTVIVATFREHGSHSAGAGPLALIALTALAIAGANALVAALLAWLLPATRATWWHIGFTTLALLVATAIGVVLVLVF